MHFLNEIYINIIRSETEEKNYLGLKVTKGTKIQRPASNGYFNPMKKSPKILKL